MPRTQLFSLLRKAAAIGRHARMPGSPPLDELIDWKGPRLSRRAFNKTLGAAGVAAGAWSLGACRAPARFRPRVAIIGAGMAGLTAAFYLRQAGISAAVYEASDRIGGRMHTARGLMGPGTWTELGGEFIDSDHDEMWALIDRFGLETIDMHAEEERRFSDVYFFGGVRRTSREVVEAFVPLAGRIDRDFQALGEEITYLSPGDAVDLDRMSLDSYLDRIGASGWIRDLIAVAYTGEYGLDPGEQSALNLIALISTDVTGDELALFGDSDERYKIVGGNQTLPERLAAELDGEPFLEHRLSALSDMGSEYVLAFERAGRSPVEARVDYVILTVPFTILRDIPMRLAMRPAKRMAIDELGYGTNAKLLFGTDERIWRARGESGVMYSDERFQLAWDHTRAQPGRLGGMTIFLGGREGVASGDGTPAEAVARYMNGLERAMPGISEMRNERVARFHWPTHPYTLGSYACYRPGQWTRFGGAEGEPVDRVLFAGEHCSMEYQGFMNGAAETGRAAAERILAQGRRRRAA